MTFNDEREARRCRALVEAQGHARTADEVLAGFGGVAPSPTGPTVAEWSSRWLASLTGIEDRTRNDYGHELRLHILPILGTVPPRSRAKT